MDTLIGRIFTAQSMQIRFLAVTSFLIFFNMPVYFIKESISYSSIAVCLHKLTLMSVIGSADDMYIINMN